MEITFTHVFPDPVDAGTAVYLFNSNNSRVNMQECNVSVESVEGEFVMLVQTKFNGSGSGYWILVNGQQIYA